jgi:transaldolase
MTGNASPLHTLAELGQSVWYDNIHRQLIESGALQRMVAEDGLSGVTSNPAIFEKAVTGGSDYDRLIADALGRGTTDPEGLFVALAATDIADAADVLRPVHDRTDGRDGYVSIEVSPLLADDTRATIDEAHRLFDTVARPNVMIKVPGTRAGLGAIAPLIADGIPVNVTLLFSPARYREVAEAYLQGLETRLASGKPLAGIASVASFFVSRVDAAVDPQLAETHPRLTGRAAIANARAAYRHYLDVFRDERFQRLERAGAQPQRLLWASTSTKNPAYPDTLYVDELIGAETVTTLPPATFEAYRDHGTPAPRLAQPANELDAYFAALEAAGINLEAETQQLERDGVQAFVDAYRNLLRAVEDKANALSRESA